MLGNENAKLEMCMTHDAPAKKAAQTKFSYRRHAEPVTEKSMKNLTKRFSRLTLGRDIMLIDSYEKQIRDVKMREAEPIGKPKSIPKPKTVQRSNKVINGVKQKPNGISRAQSTRNLGMLGTKNQFSR